MEFNKKIIQCLRRIRYHNPHKVFCDFCEMAACTFYNRIRTPLYEQREERYLTIVREYERQDVQHICKALSFLMMALSQGMKDVLGSVFMEMELGNDHAGQFLTPYHICTLMAELNLANVSKEQDYISILEPCVGAGAMCIATAYWPTVDYLRLSKQIQNQSSQSAVEESGALEPVFDQKEDFPVKAGGLKKGNLLQQLSFDFK